MFFSLIPGAETIPQNILYTQTPAIQSGIPAVNHIVNPLLSGSLTHTAETSVSPVRLIALAASIVWVVGMLGMLLYSVIAYMRLRRQVRACLRLRDNIYFCDNIRSPFILGILRPRIYLPSGMAKEVADHVITHENAHLKRRDHWWKPLSFALLTVYWFNPLVWIAYILLCRDIEMACDERVIRNMGSEEKKAYTEALVACSLQRRAIVACPLAFGEVGVKARVRSVLHYKKPAFWLVLAALIACVALSVGFLTNPVNVKQTSDASDDAPAAQNPEFYATVREFHDTYLLVEPAAGEVPCAGYPVEISTTLPAGATLPALSVGDMIRIVYDGQIQETYPTKLPTVYAIQLVYDHDGETIEPSAVFGYTESTISLTSSVALYPNGTFRFSFSPLSSYDLQGIYELTDTELILTTVADDRTYRFKRDGTELLFAADLSAPLPSEHLQFPIPDGARFVPTDNGLSASVTKPDSIKVNQAVIVEIRPDVIVVEEGETGYIHCNDSRYQAFSRFAFPLEKRSQYVA